MISFMQGMKVLLSQLRPRRSVDNCKKKLKKKMVKDDIIQGVGNKGCWKFSYRNWPRCYLRGWFSPDINWKWEETEFVNDDIILQLCMCGKNNWYYWLMLSESPFFKYWPQVRKWSGGKYYSSTEVRENIIQALRLGKSQESLFWIGKIDILKKSGQRTWNYNTTGRLLIGWTVVNQTVVNCIIIQIT